MKKLVWFFAAAVAVSLAACCNAEEKQDAAEVVEEAVDVVEVPVVEQIADTAVVEAADTTATVAQ